MLSGLDVRQLSVAFEQYVTRLAQHRPEQQDALQQLAELEQRHHRLTRLYLDGFYDNTQYTVESARIEAQSHQLHQQLEEIGLSTLRDTLQRLTVLRSEINQLPTASQRDEITETLARVEVSAGHVTRLHPRAWLKPLWGLVEPCLPDPLLLRI